MTVNCQGIRSKTSEFAATIDYVKPDIVCGVESWLYGFKPGKQPETNSIKNCEVFPPNYLTYRNDRNNIGGGVFILAHDSLVTTELIKESDIDGAELSWAQIKTSAKDLFVCSFYMPHRDEKHLKKLDSSLEMILSKSKDRNIILCGDFNCPNINWENHSVAPRSPQREVQQMLITIAEKYNLHQVHEQPTREGNLLDLVFTTNPTLLKASVSIPGVADHDMVVSDFCIKPYVSKQCPRKCYKFWKADWEGLKAAASNISTRVSSLFDDGADVNTLWTTFKKDLFSAIDKYIPSCMKTSKHKVPWVTQKLLKMIKRKKRIYKQAKKSGNWKNYKFHQKECRKTFRRAEWQYLNDTITTGLAMKNTKPFWKYIKSKKQDNIGIAPLKQNGKLLSDGKSKAEILVQQFRSVFTKQSSKTLPDVANFPEISKLVISTEGVKKLLTNIVTSKAVGPDGIPNQVLNMCATELAEGLTKIFQKSIDTGILPEDWRNANVAPVFKKGDKHLAENYRPVSLTSVTCKLLEHIISSHMLKHFDSLNILTPLNHGFRKGYSCESQLVVTLHDLCSSFDKNIQTDIAILDFSKAFDTVPHDRLLHKLEGYGIRGELSRWLSSFLTQRRMKVIVEGQHSQDVPVDSGVPQGTVLGPLLFLCHINDLPASVQSQVRLFADDCLLYRNIKSQADHAILQQDLNNLEQWADDWGMRFNAKKCYILSVKSSSSHMYQLDNQILKQVETNPYLGVTLEQNLGWSHHLDLIAKKANSSLGMLRRNLKFCPESCRLTAYVSLVRSLLEYSAVVWDPTTQKDIDKLEGIQRRSVRFIKQDYLTRKPGTMTNMLKSLNLSPLYERRKNLRLQFLYKIIDDQFPGIKKEHYMSPIQSKRQIRPKRNPNFTNQNIVDQLARNNSKCYNIDRGKTDVYRNSFFPRTIREWNSLEENIVQAESLESFKTLLTRSK